MSLASPVCPHRPTVTPRTLVLAFTFGEKRRQRRYRRSTSLSTSRAAGRQWLDSCGGRGPRQAPRPLVIPTSRRGPKKGVRGSALFHRSDALQGGNNLSGMGKIMFFNSVVREMSRDPHPPPIPCVLRIAFSDKASKLAYILAVPKPHQVNHCEVGQKANFAESATNSSRA